MPGALKDPYSDIEILKNLLKDSYKTGFPVLKEIIQNSDDAGADQLIMGWSDGLPDSKHPLLGDPAIFFINNAPLNSEDIKGIMSIASGSKKDNKIAVGKFGLGMKSLFHFGEILFFIGSGWQKIPEKAEVFNPWDKRRDEWDQFNEYDKHLIEKLLNSLTHSMNGEEYFIVWVPLRSEKLMSKRGKTPKSWIIKSDDYERRIPEFLLEKDLSIQISKILPMSKKLNEVSLHTIQRKQVEELFSVKLNKESGRLTFDNNISQQTWNGKIDINILDKTDDDLVIEYSGKEIFINEPTFQDLKENKEWPSNEIFDATDEIERNVPDKAEPHSAVVFLRRQVEKEPMLNIRWAVFLPLGEQDISQVQQSYSSKLTANITNKELSLKKQHSYDILLHGYFFIDSGRVGVHGQRNIGSNEPIEITNEESLTYEWNRQLANLGTLDCLLPSLNRLITNSNIENDEISLVLDGINGFLKQRKDENLHELLPWITRNYQFIYCISEEGSGWKIVSSLTKIRLIPLVDIKSENTEYQQILNVFQELKQFSNIVLVDEKQPNMLSGSDYYWNIEELAILLNLNVNDTFLSDEKIKYLNSFINFLTINNYGIKIKLQPLIIGLANDVFQVMSLRELSRKQSLIKQFINFIEKNKRISIGVDKDEQELWDSLVAVNTNVILIPKFLEPEYVSSSGCLDLEDKIDLLQSLSKVVNNDIQKVVLALLQDLTDFDKKEVERRCNNLKLYKARNVNETKDHLVSKFELQQLHNKRLLFTFSGLGNMGIGNELEKALLNQRLLFVYNEVNDSLFDKRIPKCDPEKVLNSLLLYPPLSEPKNRTELLSRLSGMELLQLEHRKAFRYLLHGQINADIENKLWMSVSRSDIWLKIWQLSNKGKEDAWTILPGILSCELSQKYKDNLNIHSLKASKILEELGDSIINIDYSRIITTKDEAEEVLTNIVDTHIWCNIPLHTTIEGKRVPITSNCVLDGNFTLPSEIEREIIRIRVSDKKNYICFTKNIISEFSPKKLILLILQLDNPAHYSELVFQNLELIDNLDDENLKISLKKSKWLSVNDEAVSPVQIINLSSEEFPEISNFCSYDGELHLVSELDGIFKDNIKTIEKFFISKQKSIQLIFGKASKYPDYYLGDSDLISIEAINQASKYIEALYEYPGWMLVVECFDLLKDYVSIDDVKLLCKKTNNIESMVIVNQKLTKKSIKPSSVQDIRCFFLSVICRLPNSIEALKLIKLRTAHDLFKPSTELTINSGGLSLNCIVHDKDWKIISTALGSSEPKIIEKTKNSSIRGKTSGQVLQEYLSSWQHHVSDESIALLLALMSGEKTIRNLTKKFVGQYSVEGLIDRVAKKWEIKTSYPNRPEFFSGMSLNQVVDKTRFIVGRIDNKVMVVHSIFGEEITVKLRNKPDSIFIVSKSYMYEANIKLRLIDVTNFEKEDLTSILKHSAEILMSEVYRQPMNLDSVWSEINETEQLDISIAKRMILNNITHYLKTLKVRTPPLGSLLIDEHTELQKESEVIL